MTSKKVPVIEEPSKPTEVVTPPAIEAPQEVPADVVFAKAEAVATEAASVVAASLPEASKDEVLFVTSDKTLNIAIQAKGKTYRPTMDEGKKYYIWRVEKEVADFFEKHMLVKHGRIVRALPTKK